jgi:hypothetical protein
MKTTHALKMAVVWTACLGLLSPTAVFGQTPQPNNPTSPQIRDIALTQGNVLNGQVVNAQGYRMANATVAIARDGMQTLQLSTNAMGQFQATGLPGGVYKIAGGGSEGVYRLWASRTAPPSATTGLLLVGDAGVVRGQCGDACGQCGPCVAGQSFGGPGQGLLGLLANPWFVTAAVAAAVAIPLSIDDDDAS